MIVNVTESTTVELGYNNGERTATFARYNRTRNNNVCGGKHVKSSTNKTFLHF